MRISCSRQAEAKSARGNHPGTSDTSGPSKLGRIPCPYAVLRTTVSLSLCCFIDGLKKSVALSLEFLKDVSLDHANKFLLEICVASSRKKNFDFDSNFMYIST